MQAFQCSGRVLNIDSKKSRGVNHLCSEGDRFKENPRPTVHARLLTCSDRGIVNIKMTSVVVECDGDVPKLIYDVSQRR
jgi:hypothetical protein